MLIYTDNPCDDGAMPSGLPLISSLGVNPRITKAIDASMNDWLDRHPEATIAIRDNSVGTAKLADNAVTAQKIASSAADGLRTMSTTQPGVAKVGAGLAMNNGALELNGGNIAPAVTAWLNAHPEATTTVQDKSISEKKLTNNMFQTIHENNEFANNSALRNIDETYIVMDSHLFNWENKTIISNEERDSNIRLLSGYIDTSSIEAIKLITDEPYEFCLSYSYSDGAPSLSTQYYSSDVEVKPNKGYQFIRIIIRETNDSSITPSSVSNITFAITTNVNKNILLNGFSLMYPSEKFYVANETFGFKSEVGTISSNGWDEDTRYRHFVLDFNSSLVDPLTLIPVENSLGHTFAFKIVRLNSDDTYTDLTNWFDLDNKRLGDISISTDQAIINDGDKIALIGRVNPFFDKEYLRYHPIMFCDHFLFNYGMTRKDLIKKYYIHDNNDYLPRSKYLWDYFRDSVGGGVLGHTIIQSDPQKWIQSVYFEVEDVSSISFVYDDPNVDYALTAVFLDKDTNLIGWSVGGFPGSIKVNNFTFKNGYSFSDIAYISYSIYSISETRINPETFDFDNLPIRVIINHKTESVTEVRLMEYNIGHYSYGIGQGLDPDIAGMKITGIKTMFGKYKPNILMLTEYQSQLIAGDASSNANITLYDPLWSYKTNTDGVWNTIRSDYKMFNISSDYILNPSTYNNSKPYRYCEININGHSVALCCAHLLAVFPSGSTQFNNIVEARAYELQKLIELFDNIEYGILAGDFNCSETGEKENMLSIASSAGFTPVNGGYFGWKETHSYNNPISFIDNIFVKGDITIKDFKVLYDEVDNLPSDHIPIFADLLVR